ncbi:VOC family protein, partial [uncultured Sphingomonas sp.]|uniref:VOC family protein n=1 Tax=uncultured Sphingomonas sp. TaxID=158754 RepID=UPI0035CA57FF
LRSRLIKPSCANPVSSYVTGVKSPIKLAHVVFRTSRMPEMLAWHKQVLNAKEAFTSAEISFLAYDDEHHRVAFIQIPNLAEQPAGQVGVHHVAFTYDNLETLLSNYERLKELGIEPIWPVNHGPTTSLYYGDPDGNQLEFQVDNYDTVEEAGEFFFSEAFATNPIGVDVSPTNLRERLQSGENEEAVKKRAPSGPRGVETIPIR